MEPIQPPPSPPPSGPSQLRLRLGRKLGLVTMALSAAVIVFNLLPRSSPNSPDSWDPPMWLAGIVLSLLMFLITMGLMGMPVLAALTALGGFLSWRESRRHNVPGPRWGTAIAAGGVVAGLAAWGTAIKSLGEGLHG